MKRLLCVLSSLNAGGAETYLMKLYRTIDRSKYQMDFCINVNEKCFYEDEVIRLGGKIFRIPYKSASLKEFKKGLYGVVHDNKYEFVLRVTSNTMGLMDLKIAKKAGARLCSARSSNSSDGNGIKSLAAHMLGRALYGKYADVKIAPSDLAAKYTFGQRAYRNGDVKILHNAVDLKRFYFDKASAIDIRKEFAVEDTRIIGHIGRFSEQKNHFFLLKVFAEIHSIDPNTVLMLVGQGELEEEIRHKAAKMGLSDHIIFTGVRPDIAGILSAMDVFVFPSLYEGMPNTVIEAQATGLPCLISDTITEEANITGSVKYMSLRCSEREWAETALQMINTEREDTKKIFIDNKYDIESAAAEFIDLVFGKD